MPEHDQVSSQSGTATKPKTRSRSNAVTSRKELVDRARSRPKALTPEEVAELQVMLGNGGAADLLGENDGTSDLLGGDHAPTVDADSSQVEGPDALLAGPETADVLVPKAAPALDVSGREFFLKRMQNANVRKLLDNVPSTGMGKFDAEYRPDAGELHITVRIHFGFGTGWDPRKEQEFQTKFINEVQASWSGQFRLSCTKPGFDDLQATPHVHVAPVAKAGDAHYTVNVDPGPGRAMVGRQGSQAGQTSDAKFFAPDVDRSAHGSASINCKIATHEAERMERIVDAFGPTTVQFDKNRAVLKDTGTLDRLTAALSAEKLPSAPKIPLTATGFGSKSEVSGKKSTLEKDRAKAVANYLEGRMPGHDVIEISHKEAAAKAVAEAKTVVDARKASLKEKGISDSLRERRVGMLAENEQTLATAKADAKLKSGTDQRKVEIGIDRQFEKTHTEDAYSVAVHEFGHMMGNPDEYFAYGQKTLDRRVAQLVASGDPLKVAEGLALQTKDKAGKVEKLSASDQERQDIQDSYAMLVESAGLAIPEFGSTNSSLMSAGTDLLPRHYVAIWEALGRITDPTLTQQDWKLG